MAKYERVNEPVFVTKTLERSSKYGNEIWEVEFMGVKTQKHYKTYCDPNNNNWTHWGWIIDVAERKGIVLVNCKLKDSEAGLINADSIPQAEYIVSKQELAEVLEEYWRSRDRWNTLFGDHND